MGSGNCSCLLPLGEERLKWQNYGSLTCAIVTKMMGILMDMKLLVRERYGKIYLTDTGFLLAKDLLRCVKLIRERLPAMGLDLTEEETEEYIRMMAMNLPEHCRKRLAGRT